MSQELHYTSVPRGLLPGTRGFCTVACTPNMSGPLRERLESLSGYQQVFPPHDPKVGLNPVVFSHHRLNLGGRSYSVLSRICFAGLDYTSRSNKYAHHVVLDPAERPAGGPAWLLSQPGFMEPIWLGEPRFIAAGRTPPQGDRPAGIAHAWQSLTGDAGWAGALAESFLADPRRPAFLIFEPAMDLLPLLAEALGLLPPEKRWKVEFNTYFTQLPQGLSCAWRGVLRGTAEAKKALKLPNAFIVDLSAKHAVAEGVALVEWARTGNPPNRPPEQSSELLGHGASPSQAAARVTAAPQSQHPREFSGRTQGAALSYDLIPSVQAPAWPRIENAVNLSSSPTLGWPRWLVVLASVAASAAFVLIFYYYYFAKTPGRSIIEQASQTVAKQKQEPDTVSEIKVPEHDKSPSAQPVAHKEKPRIPETDKASQAEKTNGNAAAKATTEASRKKAAPTATPVLANPVVEFFKLPQLALSQFSGKETAPGNYSFSSEIKNLSFFFPNKEVKVDPNGKTWKIVRTPTTSALDDTFEVAVFKSSANKLDFNWNKESMKRTEFLVRSELVRDSVLEVVTVNKTHYLALKGSPVRSTKAIPLTHLEWQPKNCKPSDLTRPWADEELLGDTQWRLGIQRWRIDVFPRKAGRTTLCEGDNRDPSSEVNDTIEPDRIHLKMKLEKHKVLIHLERKENEIAGDRKHYNDLKTDLEKALGEVRKQSNDPEGAKKIDDLAKAEASLKPRIDRYELLSNIADAELSITVVMRLGEKLTLDVARLGEFATPKP